MDVVLELFDTFLFDRIYATLVPAAASAAAGVSFDAHSVGVNDSLAAFGRQVVSTGYHFRPATTLYTLEPTKWAYLSAWPRDYIVRQAITLYLITWWVAPCPNFPHLRSVSDPSCPPLLRLFGVIIYFICATLSYIFVFDKATFKHPKFLKNQIRMEIYQALEALPVMAIFTVPCFVAEVRGYGKLYDATADGPGRWYDVLQFPFFIAFTDMCIYWIHRGLHHPLVYRRLHKPHHKWIMPTPYASHAFHPLDGFAQSVPYHVFPFLFPLQKFAYIALFTFINIWTVFIRTFDVSRLLPLAPSPLQFPFLRFMLSKGYADDGEYIANSPIINGAACHTMHHLYFNYNYGQFTTLWDRLGGSYRQPNEELFRRETKMGKKEWERQTKEMEKVQMEVEGEDDRAYGDSARVKKVQ
jgi:lathosterol oxidase